MLNGIAQHHGEEAKGGKQRNDKLQCSDAYFTEHLKRLDHD
jgi:hypothetical protein